MQPGLKLRTSEDGCLLPAQQECLKMLHCDGPVSLHFLQLALQAAGTFNIPKFSYLLACKF